MSELADFIRCSTSDILMAREGGSASFLLSVAVALIASSNRRSSSFTLLPTPALAGGCCICASSLGKPKVSRTRSFIEGSLASAWGVAPAALPVDAKSAAAPIPAAPSPRASLPIESLRGGVDRDSLAVGDWRV